MTDLADVRRKHRITTEQRPDGMWVAFSSKRSDSIRYEGATEIEATCRWWNHHTTLAQYVAFPSRMEHSFFMANLLWRMIRALWLKQNPDRRSWQLTDDGDLMGFKAADWVHRGQLCYRSPAEAIYTAAKEWGIEG